METRNLTTVAGIVAELHHRAWQSRAAASIGQTSKQRTTEAERTACELENLARDIEWTTTQRAALSI